MISTNSSADHHVEYFGLSTDTKPSVNVRNGSLFLEMDTSKIFAYDEENKRWLEIIKKYETRLD